MFYEIKGPERGTPEFLSLFLKLDKTSTAKFK